MRSVVRLAIKIKTIVKNTRFLVANKPFFNLNCKEINSHIFTKEA
jgi:hypothetical protein